MNSTLKRVNKKTKTTTLNCFSPPVKLTTLVTESILTVYTLVRYRMSPITRLATITLISLATFQLSEYFVCTGYGLEAEQWSRLGFVMITTLPAVGIHIMHQLAHKQERKYVYATYFGMSAFMIFFLTYHAAFIGHECTGNYVIFQMGPLGTALYSLYYYGLLLSGIFLGVKWANEIKAKGPKFHSQLQTVRALIIGYLVFLVPTALAYSIKPEDRKAIPSIMCGFAVIYALILTVYILPKATEYRIFNLPKVQKD
jgi:hypothetical protein